MVNTRKKFGGNELALAGAVKEDLACSGSSPLNKSDQVISLRAHDGECERASWSGPQASSSKRQAFEPTCSSIKRQASSPKQQASSSKPEETSSLILEPRYMDTEKVLGVQGPRVFAKIKVLCG